jgi:hypothetical protein
MQYVANLKFCKCNLQNIEEMDKNARILENGVLFLKMKGKCKRMNILMPTEQSSYRGKKPTAHNKL